jgi:uncharacterized protein (DUF58 family)
MNENRKYLDPHTIAQLASIELKAKLVVEGFITGLHRSPYHGFSVEFSEHRQYRSGDEIKHIDWQVYARSNRFYVKQYEEETNLRAMVVLDSSASMAYKSEKSPISKFEYGSYLAASLIYMMMNQRDAAGLALYDTEIKKLLPPKSKQSYIAEILKTLSSNTPSGATGTAKALDSIAERIKRRGFIVIISDFFDDKNEVMNALRHFRHQGHEVIAFQLLDQREKDFDFGYSATFKDMESDEKLLTHPYQIKQAYAKAMEEFSSQLRTECLRSRIDFNTITTNQPFDIALKEYIIKRQGMK